MTDFEEELISLSVVGLKPMMLQRFFLPLSPSAEADGNLTAIQFTSLRFVTNDGGVCRIIKLVRLGGDYAESLSKKKYML